MKKCKTIKVVKSPKKRGLLIKGISEKIKNEIKEQKEEFYSMLLRTLAPSLLGNALAGRGVIRAGEGTITTSKNLSWRRIL